MRISDWSSDVCSSDLGDAFAANFLDLLDEGKIDAVLINHIAAGIGAGGDFTPELQDFFHRVDGHVARSGNDCTLALNVMALRGQHLLHEIDRAKTRDLRDRRSTRLNSIPSCASRVPSSA